MSKTEQDIRKVFYSDIQDKKRAGSGSFNRTGKGKKHGIKGGMRYAYQNMSKEDKREYTKAGKVRTYNMYELLGADKFFKLSQEEQKEHLINWRKKYTNKEIAKTLEITEGNFYHLLAELDVPREKRVFPKKRKYSEEELEHFKKNGVDYKTFITIDLEQAYDLMMHLDEQFTRNELAELMETSVQNIHNRVNKLKKWKEKREQEQAEKKQKEQRLQWIKEKQKQQQPEQQKEPERPRQPETLELVNPEPEEKKENVKPLKAKGNLYVNEPRKLKQDDDDGGFSYTFKGEHDGEVIERKLRKLLNLVEGETSIFEVDIKLKEKEVKAPEPKKEETEKRSTIDYEREQEKERVKQQLEETINSLNEKLQRIE